MTASCDSWFYNNQLKIPAVVFGPGSLSVAHSREEHIVLDDILKAAVILARFAQDWCGRVRA
jgi:succinyl-diaminopimelate desuccinylase